MSDVFFEGDYLQLIKYEEENAKGIIIACGNTHLFLDYKTVAELLEGLNKNSYELFKTRREMFQWVISDLIPKRFRYAQNLKDIQFTVQSVIQLMS